MFIQKTRTYEGSGSSAIVFGGLLYQRASFIKLCHGIVCEGRAWAARGNKGEDGLESDGLRL
jgi:hypothetical protein